MSHKYKLKDLVRFSRTVGPSALAGSGDVYEVTRLMPHDQTGEATYRIRRMGGSDGIKGASSGEHAVRESEITRPASGR